MISCQYILKREDLFKMITGFSLKQFNKLLPLFSKHLLQGRIERGVPLLKRKRKFGGGRKSKLKTDKDKLFFILFFYRNYPTQRLAQVLFELEDAEICSWFHFLGDILFKTLGYELKLPEKKISSLGELLTVCPGLKEFIVDATERQIERPKDKEKQKDFYSGKKKRHTVKNQILIHPRTKKISSVSDTTEGKKHDKKILEETGILTKAPPGAVGMGDLGYGGANKLNQGIRFVIPLKKKKNKERTKEEKALNKAISSIRIRVEHVIGKLKINKILRDPFRSNIKTADLVFKNCACIYNFKLRYAYLR